MRGALLQQDVFLCVHRRNHKEMFFKHLRNVRESKRGEELKQVK